MTKWRYNEGCGDKKSGQKVMRVKKCYTFVPQVRNGVVVWHFTPRGVKLDVVVKAPVK
jgi:hypothetical protein